MLDVWANSSPAYPHEKRRNWPAKMFPVDQLHPLLLGLNLHHVRVGQRGARRGLAELAQSGMAAGAATA
jgi:hypothetical protein